jgi:hypothetical protein
MPLSIDIFNKKILSSESRFGTYNILLSGDAPNIKLTPIDTPISPVAGEIYFSSGDNHFYGYNGSEWKQLDN